MEPRKRQASLLLAVHYRLIAGFFQDDQRSGGRGLGRGGGSPSKCKLAARCERGLHEVGQDGQGSIGGAIGRGRTLGCGGDFPINVLKLVVQFERGLYDGRVTNFMTSPGGPESDGNGAIPFGTSRTVKIECLAWCLVQFKSGPQLLNPVVEDVQLHADR